MPNENSLLEEAEILPLVAAGDEVAFARLFHRHRHRVYGLARKLVETDVQAEDVLQEIFLKLWSGRKKLKEIRDFKAYLAVLTRNQVYNALRRQALQEAYNRHVAAGDSPEATN